MNRTVHVRDHDFDYIVSGYKTFIQEIRKKGDVYKAGDPVIIKEFDYDLKVETGREATFFVGYGVSEILDCCDEVFYTYSLLKIKP